MTDNQASRGGSLRRGWQLTKSAWMVLSLDKELAALPLISGLVGLLALVPFGLIAYLRTDVTGSLTSPNSSINFDLGYFSIPFWLSLYIVSTIIANFFVAALCHGALQRFRGGNPTISSCIKAAWHRKSSLAAFSVFSGTVGYALRLLEERVPFAGRIALWLVNAAWSIATLFAIPIIVDSQEPLGPVEATKRSANMIRKTFGENVAISLGISAVAGLSCLLFFVVVGLLGGIAIALGGSIIALAITIGVSLVGLIPLIIVFSVLETIARTAVYYYATTGEAPEVFNKELVRAALRPKKARKIFA